MSDEAARTLIRQMWGVLLLGGIVVILVVVVVVNSIAVQRVMEEFRRHAERSEYLHAGLLCSDMAEEYETLVEYLPKDLVSKAVTVCPRLVARYGA